VSHRRGGKLAWANANRKQPNIISISKPRTGHHPNEKPVELVTRFIELHTQPGDTVLDPFCGSGTTGLVALRHNRSFLGFDLNPDYCELARNRIIDDAPLLNTPLEAVTSPSMEVKA
jgi:DNA modification methylase